MPISAIILAAGKSTRMKSAWPKTLHEVCGRPMLHYVLQACYEAGCEKVMMVVGHAKEQVKAAFADDKRITWIEQTEQLGTGHAARMCEAELKKQGHGDVFVLAGDGPLIRGEVLRTLLNAHHDERAAASMATAVLDNPFGYGRIIRDEDGEFVEIIEENDATDVQRAIREVFPSYYCIKADSLIWALSQLQPNNKKGEYYLTDIYAHLRKAGKKVLAVQAVSADDVIGVNTRQHLAEVDEIMQGRIHRRLREDGVTITDSKTTYIEADVSIGAETIIRPFVFIGRESRIGGNCVIGPFTSLPRQSVVPEGTIIGGGPVR